MMFSKVTDPYLRLIRFDKPIGTLLLFWPTFWALLIAGNGHLSVSYVLVFSLGTFLMRSAGCIANDLADRNFDGRVKRTRSRVLATGELSVKQALFFMGALFFAAALLLPFLNMLCLELAIAAFFLTLFYPFCKRFFKLPQLILSVTFSFGVLMAFAALENRISPVAWLLYAITALWIFTFDTMYALSDIKDDLNLELHSSAITLGRHVRLLLAILILVIQILWTVLAHWLNLGPLFFISLGLSSGLFFYQMLLINEDDANDAFKAFLNNQWIGLLMFVGLWFSL